MMRRVATRVWHRMGGRPFSSNREYVLLVTLLERVIGHYACLFKPIEHGWTYCIHRIDIILCTAFFSGILSSLGAIHSFLSIAIILIMLPIEEYQQPTHNNVTHTQLKMSSLARTTAPHTEL